MRGPGGFFSGLLLGGALASVGWGTFVHLRGPEPRVEPDADDATGSAPPREAPIARPRARKGARPARAAGGGEARGDLEAGPEPLRLSAADLRAVARGDDLSRPDVVHLDLGDGRPARELDQSEIDARFQRVQGEVLDCIARARPDEVTYVAGQVTVGFRIARSGEVRGVRVEAPAILHAGGLYACIRAVVAALRFPASDTSQVVTYPFRLS